MTLQLTLPAPVNKHCSNCLKSTELIANKDSTLRCSICDKVFLVAKPKPL